MISFCWSRNEIFFAINQLHNPIADWLMTLFSAFGRGDTIAITFVLLLIFPVFRTRQYLATTLLFGLLLPAVNHFSKDFFSKPRPLGEFYEHKVHTVTWLENLYFDSFPSGHTMGAFGFFLLLNYFIPKKNPYLSVLLFMLALSCGYSRIYLGQHFFADVLAGSITGVVVSLCIISSVYLFMKKNENHG
jgi:membrane-associated phospholipid phosphatase